MNESTSLTHVSGDSLLLPFELIDEATGEAPTDVKIVSGRSHIKQRKKQLDSEADVTLTVTVLSDTSGQASATAAQMELAPVKYFYYVEITGENGEVITILNDTITVLGDVSNG